MWVCRSGGADLIPHWEKEIPFLKFIKQQTVCKFDQETQKDSTATRHWAESCNTAESTINKTKAELLSNPESSEKKPTQIA